MNSSFRRIKQTKIKMFSSLKKLLTQFISKEVNYCGSLNNNNIRKKSKLLIIIAIFRYNKLRINKKKKRIFIQKKKVLKIII